MAVAHIFVKVYEQWEMDDNGVAHMAKIALNAAYTSAK